MFFQYNFKKITWTTLIYIIILLKVNETKSNIFSNNIMSGGVSKKSDAESFYMKQSQEIGTILFEDHGFTKKCFTQEDMALLAARMKFQSLLPTKSTNLENDESVESKIRYFYAINDVISKMGTRQTKEVIINKAFFDMLGGYLKHFLLPITKYSFYAGNVSFTTANNLFILYDKCKELLNTNGNSWKNPISDFSSFSFHIEKIIISKEAESDEPMKACVNLILNKDDNDNDESMLVALPKMEMEESEDLSTIWLPFKRKHTFNLNSKTSAFILLKYFVQVSKCYDYQGASQANFNRKLKTWLSENILPYLDDDKLYPAFGAILRILESVKQSSDSGYFGVSSTNHHSPIKTLFSEHKEKSGGYGMLRMKNQDIEDYDTQLEEEYIDVRNYINLGVIIVGSFVFLLVLIFCSIKMSKNRSKAKKKRQMEPCYSPPTIDKPTDDSEDSKKSNIAQRLKKVFTRSTDEEEISKKGTSSDEASKIKNVTWENEKRKKKSSEKLKVSPKSSGIMKKKSEPKFPLPITDSDDTDEDILLNKLPYNFTKSSRKQEPHSLYKIDEERDSEVSSKSSEKKFSSKVAPEVQQSPSKFLSKLRKRSKSPKKEDKGYSP